MGISRQTQIWWFGLAAFFAAEALIFVRWIPDDAFISFRYARNIADGVGMVFNAGDRVEGASSTLWTVLLGLLTRAGMDTVWTAVTISLACALASIAMTVRLFSIVLDAGDATLGERRRYLGLKRALAVGLVVSLPMIFYATSGMETHAELALLLLGAVLHLEARARKDPWRFAASQFALLGVAFVRPEGIAFLLVGSAFVAFNALVLGFGTRGRIVAWSGVALPLIVYAALESVKASYFGSFLPNTYLAKPGASFEYLFPLWRGTRFLVRYFLVSGAVLILPFCAAALTDRSRRYSSLFLAALVGTQFAFIVLVGGDVLRFHRFAVPFIPFLLALALVGFIRLDAVARVHSRRLSVGAAVFCVALMAMMNVGRVVLVVKKECAHDWMHARVHRAIGAFLRETLPADASVAVNEVGAIAYESGLVTHDMLGLTDATVGRILYESFQRYGGAGAVRVAPQIAEYIVSKQPDCVIVPSYGPIEPGALDRAGDVMHPMWEAVFAHPELARNYLCTFFVRINDRKYLYFYIKIDVDPDSVAEAAMRSLSPYPCGSVGRCGDDGV